MPRKLFALLGWEFARKPNKRRPFDNKAEVLGAVLDLTGAGDGVIEVTNKQSRIEDLTKAIEDMKSLGWLSPARAASLKGKVSYAKGQLFGRVAAVMLPELRRRARPGAFGMRVTQSLIGELTWMRDFLASSIPRRILARDVRPLVVVLTDAFLSGDCNKVGVGAVLLDPKGDASRSVSAEVPNEVLKKIQTETKYVITALEVLPVYFVRRLWNAATMHRRCFAFIDNDGARHSLLRCRSGSQSVLLVLRRIVLLQAEWACYMWYSRVPSPSNIVDGPSRGEIGDLTESGAARDLIDSSFWREALA